ncbi:unnamed protein product [Camellia sinensis]
MAVQGRLNTGDRVKQFGISQSLQCYVCHNPYEDHSHLFFHCPFSDRVWNVMKIKLNISWLDLPWFELVQLLSQQIRGKSLGSVISRLAFNCTVYQLWMTRNNRFFNGEFLSDEVVIKQIIDMVQFRMLSVTNLNSNQSDRWFLETWRLPDSILKNSITLLDPVRRVLRDVRSL